MTNWLAEARLTLAYQEKTVCAVPWCLNTDDLQIDHIDGGGGFARKRAGQAETTARLREYKAICKMGTVAARKRFQLLCAGHNNPCNKTLAIEANWRELQIEAARLGLRPRDGSWLGARDLGSLFEAEHQRKQG